MTTSRPDNARRRYRILHPGWEWTTIFLPVFVGGALLLAASTADAQYRNLEVERGITGGYSGTFGNQNFEIGPGDSSQFGGRRPGVIEGRAPRTKGNVGATQRRCFVDGNGNAACQ